MSILVHIGTIFFCTLVLDNDNVEIYILTQTVFFKVEFSTVLQLFEMYV